MTQPVLEVRNLSVALPKGEHLSPMPEKCPRCDADYRHRTTFKSPLRNHRTGFQKATQVLASGWLQRKKDDVAPDFGLYLDSQWAPTGPFVMLDWPDFGVPSDRSVADREIRGALARARVGERVEVACIGGHGRTGTVLACMAILAGIPADEAVEWVRTTYCRRAVQEPSQQYWIDRFSERVADSASG